MTPLLLLFLLSLTTASTQVCNEHSACLYFATCFDESSPNSTRPQPTANATLSRQQAVDWKESCKGTGFISTLSIAASNRSHVDVSFETDNKTSGLSFENTETGNTIKVDSAGNGEAIFNGVTKGFNVTKFTTLESVTYRARLAQQDLPLHSFVGAKISLISGDRRFEMNASDFYVADVPSQVEDSPSTHEKPVAPDAQVVPEGAETTAEPTEEAHRTHLPGSKWIWIGGAGAVLILIIVINIVVCLICRRRNRNDTTRKQGKTTKRAAGKKGGKDQPPSSDDVNPDKLSPSSNAPGSQPPSAEQPSVNMAVTEMNLDRLKTERL